MSVISLRLYLRELFFPVRCVLCKGPLLESPGFLYGICPACSFALVRNQAPLCRSCGRPLYAEKNICMLCRRYDGAKGPWMAIQGRALSLFPYRGKAKTLMRAWKFGRHRQLSRYIGRHFFKAYRSLGLPLVETQLVLVPAPSSPGKRLKSGWDHMFEVVKEFSRLSGCPYSLCLVRSALRSQKALSRKERALNMRDAIRCVGRAPLHVLLIDDVTTTGATLRASAFALYRAGCQDLSVFSFCYD